MKKVLLTGTTLFAFVAASYAQNTSTVNQNGNQQRASATQTGNLFKSNIQQTSSSSVTNQGNYAETTQRQGKSSEAFINQIGSKSGYAKVIQEGGNSGANVITVNQKNNTGGSGTLPTATATPGDVTAAGGNYAFGYQNGSNQTATINQNTGAKGNQATVDQANFGSAQTIVIDQNNSSTDNKATAGQAGGGNAASISQSTNSRSNTTEVVQGISTFYGGPNSYNATATVEQNGSVGALSFSNNATIKQLGVSSGAVATIRQNAFTDASGNNAASVSNEGSITQTNDGNAGTIDQNNGSIRNKATISQDAANGSATVNQSNNATDNVATLKQISGSGLKVDVQQTYGANRNTTTTNQYGTNSEISVEQVASSDNKATIDQGAASTTSANNKARVYQKDGSQKGEITISQNLTKDGTANYAQVEQAYPSGTSTGNKATIGQEGSRNVTRLGQTGTGNHVAMISQTGNNNLVQGPGTSLYEVGPMATQKGEGNKMTVSQTSPDGTNTAVFNTANLSQDGLTNTINLTQTATTVNNISTLSQIGTNNLTTVTQTGMTP